MQMKQLKFILIIALFLLALPLLSIQANALGCGVLINDTLDSGENWTLRGGCTINASGDGLLNCVNGDGIRYLNTLFNQSNETNPFNYSVAFDWTSATGAINYLFFYDQNLSNSGINPSASLGFLSLESGDDGYVMNVYPSAAKTKSVYAIANSKKRMEFVFEGNGTVKLMNRTVVAGAEVFENTTTRLESKNISYFGDHFGQGGHTFTLDNFTVTNLSANCAAAADTTKPIVNVSINNTSPKRYEIINTTANITDETGLSTANITINFSTGKVFKNYTISGTSATIYNITNITDSRGNVLNITVYATDTSNNVRQNSTLITVADTTPTFTIANNNTSPKINEVLQLSSLTSDNDGISTIIFSWNGSSSGLWINVSNITSAVTNLNYTVNVTLSRARGNRIGFLFYSNDSVVSTFTASSVTTFDVTDTPITFTSFANTSDLTYTTNQTINWTCTDPDTSDTITSNAYFDTINPPLVQVLSNSVHNNFTTNMTSEVKHYLNVTCTSNSVTAYSTIFNITLDVSTPSCTNFPANNTFYRVDTNISTTCTDNLQLFEINSSIRNFAGTVIYNSTNITNLTGTSYIFNTSIKVTELGDAQYNLSQWAGDTKNKKRAMDNWFVGKTDNNRTLQFNYTPSGLQCNISYGTTNPSEKKFLPVSANVSLKMNIDYIDNNYYKIVYDVVAPNTGFISATEFICNQKITQVNDGIAGHLLLGTGKEKLSYDAQDLVDSGFNVTTKISDDNTFMQVIKKSGIVEGAVVSYDPKADNLNIVEYSSTIEIDTGVPQFFNLSLATTRLLPNNTFISASILNFTYNVSDKNNQSVLFYINNIKNASFGYKSNLTQNATITFSDGNYTILMEINDSANNKLNSTFINIVVDTTHQNITNITPLNNTFTSNSNVNFTANITETNPDKMELWINSTGTWHLNRTASYSSNITANFSLFNLSNGIYKWTVCANDSAGGRSCFAENYTLTVDSTLPTITLNSPFNNTVQTAGEPPNVNFRISSNEIVKNCSLFLSESLVGNESTQKQSHNFTVNSIAGGVYKWNATCYDLANNLGASKIFNLEIKIISGGSGSVSEPAGGGGGIGIPTLIEEEEIIDKGYTMTYICGKVRKFLNENPNYDLSNIVLLQEDIRFEINFVIPFTTLKGYVDNYEQFCGIKKQENITQQPIATQPKSNRFLKLPKFNFGTFFKLPFKADFGIIGSNGEAFGLFDFINLFLPLSISDELSENPNIVWEGGVRIIPAIAIILVLTIIVAIAKIYRSKKNLDVLSNIVNLKKKAEGKK